MGRLTKAKIDRIIKLRDEGYTQKEVSEKIGVDIKTVRKYDSQKLTSETGDQKDDVQMVDLISRIEKLENSMYDMAFGKMRGCPFLSISPKDSKGDAIRYCSRFTWNRAPTSHIYHGLTDNGYFDETHSIKINDMWYKIPTVEDCKPCFDFKPKT